MRSKIEQLTACIYCRVSEAKTSMLLTNVEGMRPGAAAGTCEIDATMPGEFRGEDELLLYLGTHGAVSNFLRVKVNIVD